MVLQLRLQLLLFLPNQARQFVAAGVAQDQFDLIQRTAILFQFGDQQNGFELLNIVVPIPVVPVDDGWLQQADFIIVSQGFGGDVADFGKLAYRQHGIPSGQNLFPQPRLR